MCFSFLKIIYLSSLFESLINSCNEFQKVFHLSLLSLITSYFTAGMVALSPCHMAILKDFWDRLNYLILIH